MKYKAIIFDLDGTLTYTLEDLKNSVNYALTKKGWPKHSLEAIRTFVGNGIHRLIELSVPQGTSPEDLEDCFNIFKDHYVIHCQDNTRLYEGIEELLKALKSKGYKMAIVSNKLQAGVDELYKQYFESTIDVAIGERAGMARKPQPDMVELAMSKLKVTKDQAIYIGDSEVDLMTARNSALPCISVLWGFRDKDFLIESGADLFAESPLDILKLV